MSVKFTLGDVICREIGISKEVGIWLSTAMVNTVVRLSPGARLTVAVEAGVTVSSEAGELAVRRMDCSMAWPLLRTVAVTLVEVPGIMERLGEESSNTATGATRVSGRMVTTGVVQPVQLTVATMLMTVPSMASGLTTAYTRSSTVSCPLAAMSPRFKLSVRRVSMGLEGSRCTVTFWASTKPALLTTRESITVSPAMRLASGVMVDTEAKGALGLTIVRLRKAVRYCGALAAIS